MKLLFTIMVMMAVQLPLQAQGTTSVGGYGELHYNKNTYSPGKPRTDRVGSFDFHRFVIFLGHDFSEKVSFKSELEVEHTQVKSSNTSSELSLEQAYVDVKFSDAIGLRTGIMLVPVGYINEFHEPNTFNGVERPSVDRVIIPSTWREAGIGLFGQWDQALSWRVYLQAGLDPSKINQTGIRSARQSGYYSKSSDMAVTGRIEYLPTLNLKTGFSFYTNSLENSAIALDTLSGARYTLLSGDARVQFNDLSLKALVAYGILSEAKKLNAYYGNHAGSSQIGLNSEIAYNFMPLLSADADQALTVFGRIEYYDTQNTIEKGTTQFKGLSVTEWTTGITWHPDPNVAFKLDYQWIDPDGSSAMTQKINAGIGYYFY